MADAGQDAGPWRRAVREIDAALDATRPHRIAAHANDSELDPYLHQRLGPLPTTRGARAAWCGLAERLEAERDRGIHRDERRQDIWRALERSRRSFEPLDHVASILRMAEAFDSRPVTTGPCGPDVHGWQHTLEDASAAVSNQYEMADLRFVRTPDVQRAEPDLGLSL